MASDLRRSVRIAAWGVAAVIVAALVWAVAPAISLTPYVPEPVNFEQAVPAFEKLGGHEAKRVPAALGIPAGGEREADEGRVRYLSEPVEAPKRFDLVGLVDLEGPAEVRTRTERREWGPWVETNHAEPVWTGGADELQIRSRDRRPRGEIAYVNVSGDASPGDRALNALRSAASGAFVSVASLFAPASAEGQAPFEIVNRSEWDPADRCKPKAPVHGKVKAAVVHHTVNSNTYARAEAPGIVLAICRYHRYSRGWNDIGYNALVDRFGNLYSGRVGGLTNAVIGAHTAGFNSQTTGVASIGTHTEKGLSRAAIRSITNLLAWKMSLHGLDAAGRTRVRSAGGTGNKHPAGKRVKTREVTRHRRFNRTSCPGRAQIKKITRKTKRKIASGTYAPPSEPPPDDGGLPIPQ